MQGMTEVACRLLHDLEATSDHRASIRAAATAAGSADRRSARRRRCGTASRFCCVLGLAQTVLPDAGRPIDPLQRVQDAAEGRPGRRGRRSAIRSIRGTLKQRAAGDEAAEAVHDDARRGSEARPKSSKRKA